MKEREKIPAIIGVGAAFPEKIVDNIQIDVSLGVRKGFTSKLMRLSGAGVEERRWVVPGEQTASDLGTEALLEACEMAGIDKPALKSILVGTSSADYWGVTTGALIQRNLGLSVNVRCYDISAGCTGWAQAVKNIFTDLTSPYGDGGPQAAIGAEIISPVLSRDQRQSYPLFGDGAGATIVNLVEPDEGAFTKAVIRCGSDGRYAESLYMPAGGSKNPTTAETIKNNMHTIQMDGKIIAEQATLRMVEFARSVLEEANLPVEEITLLIPHQANEKIMHDVADQLGVPWDKVVVTIDKFGNTSTATIPTALRYVLERGKIKRNDILGFVTFGAGLTFAAGVLPMVGLPRSK